MTDAQAPTTGGDTLRFVDALAAEIRRVDGSHSLGAGALAEALIPFVEAMVEKAHEMGARDAAPVPGDEPVRPGEIVPGCNCDRCADKDALALADELCTKAHDRPTDGSEGPGCDECYGIATEFLNTDWLAARLAAAQTSRDEPAPALPVGGDAGFADERALQAVLDERGSIAGHPELARAILASDWLAARDAAIAREAAERALVEAAEEMASRSVPHALSDLGAWGWQVGRNDMVLLLRDRAASLGDGSGT